jgi:hypothetical protein
MKCPEKDWKIYLEWQANEQQSSPGQKIQKYKWKDFSL